MTCNMKNWDAREKQSTLLHNTIKSMKSQHIGEPSGLSWTWWVALVSSLWFFVVVAVFLVYLLQKEFKT